MIWQEEARGGFFDARLLGLSGKRMLESFLERGGPIPPIGHLMGTLMTEIGDGTATFEMPASPWLQTHSGVIQGGVLAVLADAALGCAIQTGLPPATPYTTAELSMTFLRPATVDSGTLTARGKLIRAGRSMALSSVELEDSQGRLVAHGTSRCHVFPPLDPAPDPPDHLEPLDPPSYETPDPYLRPVEGTVMSKEEMSGDGLTYARKCVAGEIDGPPIHYLTGLTPTEAEEERASVKLPATKWLCSPTGYLQGGAIALLADTAIAFAIQTTVPAGMAYAIVDLKVNYLRPVPPDHNDLVATGAVSHRGKTLAIANSDLTNADGKRVALATGSAMLLEP